MSEPAEPFRQLGTHRNLVSQTEKWRFGARLPLAAVIVPASRPARNLEQAITLARASDCTLLILGSHGVEPTEVHQVLAERSFDDAIVVDLPEGYRHELLDFRALESMKADLPAACFHYVSDLSTKRNLGLILARMLGWRRIFFLDDDIRDINPPDVHSTVTMLGTCRTAGMRVIQFPDNSVACHAHRMTGGLQDIFVSGAALAVDCQQDVGFFPDIYNEDWLFFYDDAAHGRLGSSARIVTQLRYDPFASPLRAERQEFGDVLAEGLYAGLDRGKGIEHATTNEYWSQFLDARRTFLQAIIDRSDTAKPEIKERLLRSVELALKCSIGIAPEVLARYVQLWRQDLSDWERRLAGVGQMRSPDAALRALGLARSTDSEVTDAARSGPAAQHQGLRTVPFNVADVADGSALACAMDLPASERAGSSPRPGEASGIAAVIAPMEPGPASDTQLTEPVCG
jgi:hypothetical protein